MFILLPLAILMAGAFLAAFLLSVRRGQYDDMDTPRYRAIFDDDGGGSKKC
ncbi:MAG TPA: cbb3-type cytochrome oxidase assembly protein CcoS [Humisphaera sp.]